jgi:predicted RNase H-like HicB family nuclease
LSRLDIASQGDTIKEAAVNLKEAVGLFFEHATENKRKAPSGYLYYQT